MEIIPHNTELEITTRMSHAEASECANAIRQNLGNLRRLVLDLYDRQGWIALGYSTWRECVTTEFKFSQSRLYQLLDAARIEQNISTIVETTSVLESHLRPLSPLAPDVQRLVLQSALDTAPNGKLTAAHVQQTANEYKAANSSIPHVAQNSGEDEWYTPPEYIEAARLTMGEIDLDPASSDAANSTVQATRYFTALDDGLSQRWSGRVWMNPPYQQPLIKLFAVKLVESYLDGSIESACVLVNNATDTSWFQVMMKEANCICFVRGRIKFLNANGDPVGAPLQGQAVLHFGANPHLFSRYFAPFGEVLYVH